MSFYHPSPRRRSYSLSQPSHMAGSSYPYPTTPYSGYNSLAPTYNDMPGYSPQTFYVAPSISGRSRSRSRSRPRHSHGHSHSHGHGHSQRRSRSHHRHHVPQRRSHSTTSHRLQRPNHQVRFSMAKTERSAHLLLLYLARLTPITSNQDYLSPPITPLPFYWRAHPQFLWFGEQ